MWIWWLIYWRRLKELMECWIRCIRNLLFRICIIFIYLNWLIFVGVSFSLLGAWKGLRKMEGSIRSERKGKSRRYLNIYQGRTKVKLKKTTRYSQWTKILLHWLNLSTSSMMRWLLSSKQFISQNIHIQQWKVKKMQTKTMKIKAKPRVKR